MTVGVNSSNCLSSFRFRSKGTRTNPIVLCNTPDLVVVVSSGQGLQPVGVELAAGWVQLLAVVFGQLGAERVDGDDEGPAVSLKLFKSNKKNLGI